MKGNNFTFQIFAFKIFKLRVTHKVVKIKLIKSFIHDNRNQKPHKAIFKTILLHEVSLYVF